MAICGLPCAGLSLGYPVVSSSLKHQSMEAEAERNKNQEEMYHPNLPLSHNSGRGLLPTSGCQTIKSSSALPTSLLCSESVSIKSCPSSPSALNSTQCNFWEDLDPTYVYPTSQAPQLPSCSFPFELITETKAKTQPGRFANSSRLFLQTASAVVVQHKRTQSNKPQGICAGNSQ